MGLSCEWTIYPSDIFTLSPLELVALEDYLFRVDIETYPEGGTVMFRVIDNEKNKGSLWFYIDLPRPQEQTVLPPPYAE